VWWSNHQPFFPHAEKEIADFSTILLAKTLEKVSHIEIMFFSSVLQFFFDQPKAVEEVNALSS
jgi:hypothetical protein